MDPLLDATVPEHSDPNTLRVGTSLWLPSLALGATLTVALMVLLPIASGLVLFALYSIPSNSLLPIPHEPGLLYFAKYYDAIWISIAGVCGAGIATVTDYAVVRGSLRFAKVRELRDGRVTTLAIRWFRKSPFLTVALFALSPLPVYVVRILAPLAGYPLWRYTIAIMLGRLPRFYVVAVIGRSFLIPTWALLAVFVLLLASTFTLGRLK